jgi:uncharacterized membrane protein
MGLGIFGFLLIIALNIAFWGLVIGGAMWVVDGLRGVRRRERGTALEILDRRLASGEIDAEEYRRLRAELIGGAPPPSPSPAT